MSFIEKLRKTKEEFLSGISVPEASEFKPDDFQLQAIESATGGHDTLVVAPTGAGKTYIAVQSIVATLLQNTRAVYTTPLKALSNSKYNEFKAKFEPKYQVGLLTGDRKIDTGADIVIATTEIYRNELYRGDSSYSLAILDEVHYIADAQRGAVWEEAILFTPRDTTLLMLSASISNYKEIAEWLEKVRGKPCRVVIAKERPVELRLGFLHPDLGVMPLNQGKKIFNLVKEYYLGMKLDNSGMRLKGKRGFNNKDVKRSQNSSRRKGRKNRRGK